MCCISVEMCSPLPVFVLSVIVGSLIVCAHDCVMCCSVEEDHAPIEYDVRLIQDRASRPVRK